jgi:transposase
MIPTPTQVWLVVEAIDMRVGIDGLSLRIQNTLGRSPAMAVPTPFLTGGGIAFHSASLLSEAG